MADDFDQSWRGANRNRPGKREAWQVSKEPTDHRTASRRLKLGLLATAGVVIAGGIVALILMLRPPLNIGLIAFGNDPNTTATRLHGPYDPFGYASAEWLLKWTAAQKPGERESPSPISDTPWSLRDFDGAISRVVSSNMKAVVMYFGLPGRVDGTGEPCLVTSPKNPGDPFPDAIKVTTLLDELSADSQRRAIQFTLVFDNGRESLDPNRGEIESHFAEAMLRTVGPKLAQYPHVCIILGAAPGQIGGESPKAGVTPVAKFLADAMYPMQTDGGVRTFAPVELFDSLKKKVSDWSVFSRPTAQTPVMLPEAPSGLIEKRIFYRRKIDLADLPPTRAGDSFDLGTWRNVGDRLSQQRVPVTAYTPAAWRQFRELHLRLEKAALAGDTTGRNLITTALADQQKRIEQGLGLTVDSADYSLAMPVALGRDARHGGADPVNPNASVTTLASAAQRAAVPLDQRRPVEAHLAVMMQDYLGKRDQTVAFADWKSPLATRRLAERAATGLQPDNRFPYAEAVWPRIAETVIAGDRLRRLAEDQAFVHLSAPIDGFKQADGLYITAIKTAAPIQRAIALRDRALADLPYWGRWAIERNSAEDVGTVERAWSLAHLLAARIARKETTDQTVTDLDALFAKLTESVAKNRPKPVTNPSVDDWNTLQPWLQLPAGLVTAAERTEWSNTAKSFTDRDVLKDPPSGEFKAPTGRDARRQYRQRLIAAAFGPGDSLVKRRFVSAEASEFRADEHAVDSAEFQVACGTLAKKAVDEWRSLADPDALIVNDAIVADDQRIVASRIAIPLPQVVEKVEPAVRVGREQWRRYLEAMAQRIATDHWYGENDRPYFANEIAAAMLADADAVPRLAESKETPRVPSTDRLATQALIDLEKNRLQLKWSDRGTTADRSRLWTNESKKEVGYRLTKYELPDGQATVWPVVAGGALFSASPGTGAVAVAQPSDQKITLTTTAKLGEKIDLKILPYAVRGFFRGRYLRDDASFVIRRTPDYVATEIRDPERKSVLSLRSGNDFDAGSLTIIIDLSGSMAFTWDGYDPNDKDNPTAWKASKEPRIRKDVLLKVLEDLLKSIPPTTKLTIRYFIAPSENEDSQSQTLAIDNPIDGPSIVARLREIARTPRGATPLIATIAETLKTDAFRGNDPNTEHQIVVLTDGTDNSVVSAGASRKKKQTKYEGYLDIEATLRRNRGSDLNREFLEETQDLFRREILSVIRNSPTKIGVHIIQFGTAREEKKPDGNVVKDDAFEFSRGIFEQLSRPYDRNGTTEYPGQFYEAERSEELVQYLAQALRPKPRLTQYGGAAIADVDDPKKPTYIPPSGIPTNVFSWGTDDRQFANMWWWGYLDNGPFKLRFGSDDSRDVSFDNGLNLFLRLERGAGLKPSFRRELYFRDIDTRWAGKNQTDNSHPDWHLAVIDSSRHSSTAFSVTSSLEAKNETQVLSPLVPELTWWDLSVGDRQTGKRFTGDVTVRNLSRLHAPCWQVVGREFQSASRYGVRVVAVRESDLTARIKVGTAINARRLRPDDLANLPTTLDDDVSIRISLEPYDLKSGENEVRAALDDDAKLPASAQIPAPCLIIRIEDAKGRRLRARLKNPDLRKQITVAEHQYFYDDTEKEDAAKWQPKVKAYAAIFGPIRPADSITQDIEIEFFDLGHASLKPTSVSDVPLNQPVPPPSPKPQLKKVAKAP